MFFFDADKQSTKGNALCEALQLNLNYRRVNMVTIANSDKRSCKPWRKEAITGLKSVGKRKV